MKLFAYLEGKKSYIVAACLIAYAIGGVVTGHMTYNEAIILFLNGSGMASIRAALPAKN